MSLRGFISSKIDNKFAFFEGALTPMKMANKGNSLPKDVGDYF
jgi:hypothetical protein